MDHKLRLLYASLAIGVVIAAGIFWYLWASQTQIVEEAEPASATVQIETETNPVKSVPDLNPTDKTNPFKARNPFE